jgi:hypothetical protein
MSKHLKNHKDHKGGAEIELVEKLHRLTVKALLQQIQTEMDEGCVKAATVTAALKLCTDSHVIASFSEADDVTKLSSMLDSLNLTSPVY